MRAPLTFVGEKKCKVTAVYPATDYQSCTCKLNLGIFIPPTKEYIRNGLFYLYLFAILNFDMETPKREPLIRELKNYLIHLKDVGYTEIPCEAELFANVQHRTAQPSQSPNEMAKNKSLTAVQKELGDCTCCKLSETRKNIVFGSGNPNADLVFVGEGPGADEDEQGLPFIGRAGKKLTEIIEKGMGLNREKTPISATSLNVARRETETRKRRKLRPAILFSSNNYKLSNPKSLSLWASPHLPHFWEGPCRSPKNAAPGMNMPASS